jgi:hypothetical protein
MSKFRIQANTYRGESCWISFDFGFSLYRYDTALSAILHGQIWKKKWQIRLHNME